MIIIIIITTTTTTTIIIITMMIMRGPPAPPPRRRRPRPGSAGLCPGLRGAAARRLVPSRVSGAQRSISTCVVIVVRITYNCHNNKKKKKNCYPMFESLNRTNRMCILTSLPWASPSLATAGGLLACDIVIVLIIVLVTVIVMVIIVLMIVIIVIITTVVIMNNSIILPPPPPPRGVALPEPSLAGGRVVRRRGRPCYII